jgi:hypothetical protein
MDLQPLRPPLSLSDLQLGKLSSLALRSSSAELRMALFEVCEIIRLVNNKQEMRDCAVQLQAELLRLTKAPHNLLKHERINKKATDPLPPLFPRSDA